MGIGWSRIREASDGVTPLRQAGLILRVLLVLTLVVVVCGVRPSDASNHVHDYDGLTLPASPFMATMVREPDEQREERRIGEPA